MREMHVRHVRMYARLFLVVDVRRIIKTAQQQHKQQTILCNSRVDVQKTCSCALLGGVWICAAPQASVTNGILYE